MGHNNSDVRIQLFVVKSWVNTAFRLIIPYTALKTNSVHTSITGTSNHKIISATVDANAQMLSNIVLPH